MRCPYEVYINQEFNCSYAIQTQQSYKYIIISFDDQSSPYSLPINNSFPYFTHFYATHGNYNISAVILDSNLFANTFIVVLDGKKFSQYSFLNKFIYNWLFQNKRNQLKNNQLYLQIKRVLQR
jgi:hypothetical protein